MYKTPTLLGGLSGPLYQPPSALRWRMIDLAPLAGLPAHRHQLAAYCPRYRCWRVLPLAHLVANGHGERRLPINVDCQDFGKVGKCQARLPMLGCKDNLGSSTGRDNGEVGDERIRIC